MSSPHESPRAVFLSYASQDAAVVVRIRDALVASGVEVWFDQNELTGGDAWDRKIRDQIKACALFVPVISANTNARREGYFRREWKLAVDRTHDMDEALPFLLPVVTDGTSDAGAFVPEKFREVQWTRLPGGETPEKFCAQVKRLLNGSEAARAFQPVSAEPTGSKARATPNAGRRISAMAWIGAAVAVLAAVVWFTQRRNEPIAPTNPPAAQKPATPHSDARPSLSRIWTLLNQPDLARAELDAVEALCKQATALDQSDGDLWAAWSYSDVWFIWYGFDESPARRESARAKSARALRLAPKSYEARLAHANYLVRGTWQPSTAAATAREVEPILRELLRERPDEPRALFLQGMFVFLQNNLSEDKSALERLEKIPEFAVVATKEIGWQHYWAGRWAKADEVANRSIALLPYWDNLGLKIQLALRWHGDLALAKATLDRLPASALQEAGNEGAAWRVLLWRRDANELLAYLNSLSREWLNTQLVSTPKALLAGQARLLLKQPDVARREFRRAADLIEQRLAADPNNADLLGMKARALHHLDERAEAEKAYRLSKEVAPPPVDLLALFETPEGAMGELEARAQSGVDFFSQWFIDLTAASLRLNPAFDPLRSHPRFAALLARAEADPRRSPKAAAAKSAVTPDEKSVAVLAFKNLSDDKDGDYFSEGISEELLNVLAKVPGLTVKARTSSFSFKDTRDTTQEIGRKLTVAHLVDGTVRKLGNAVRVVAHLRRTDTGEQMWTDRFDGTLDKPWELQDRIAARIAQELKLKLGNTGRAAKTVNPEAYRLVLEGRHFWSLRTEEGMARAGELFAKAVELDSQSAAAHEALGDFWTVRALYRGLAGEAFEADLGRGEAKARRALELDPELAQPFATLGLVALVRTDFANAERDFKKSIERAPNNAIARDWYGDLLHESGQLDRAMEEYRKAEQLDPLAFYVLSDLGWSLVNARRYAEALPVLDRAEALVPGAPRIGLQRARVLAELGEIEQGRSVIRGVLPALMTGQSVFRAPNAVYVLRKLGQQDEARQFAETMLTRLPEENYIRGAMLLTLGRWDEGFTVLEKSPVFGGHSRWMFWDPEFDAVRETPRFQRLLARMNGVENHKVARETLARLLKEQAGKK